MNNKRKQHIIAAIILLIWLSVSGFGYCETAEKKYYVYNPDFHGTFVYSYENAIVGIFLNGMEIDSSWIIKYDQHINRCAILLPGLDWTVIWINPDHLIEEWPDDQIPDILTGIAQKGRSKDGFQIHIVDTKLLSANDGDRLEIGGRIHDLYYLPKEEPHFISTSDIPVFTDHKNRRYMKDLMFFFDLLRLAEPDGTERMTMEEVRAIADDAFQQYFPELPAGTEYSVSVSLEHLYGHIGKTWYISYCKNDTQNQENIYYYVEIVDKTKELFSVKKVYESNAYVQYFVKDGISQRMPRDGSLFRQRIKHNLS